MGGRGWSVLLFQHNYIYVDGKTNKLVLSSVLGLITKSLYYNGKMILVFSS